MSNFKNETGYAKRQAYRPTQPATPPPEDSPSKQESKDSKVENPPPSTSPQNAEQSVSPQEPTENPPVDAVEPVVLQQYDEPPPPLIPPGKILSLRVLLLSKLKKDNV